MEANLKLWALPSQSTMLIALKYTKLVRRRFFSEGPEGPLKWGARNATLTRCRVFFLRAALRKTDCKRETKRDLDSDGSFVGGG